MDDPSRNSRIDDIDDIIVPKIPRFLKARMSRCCRMTNVILPVSLRIPWIKKSIRMETIAFDVEANVIWTVEWIRCEVWLEERRAPFSKKRFVVPSLISVKGVIMRYLVPPNLNYRSIKSTFITHKRHEILLFTHDLYSRLHVPSLSSINCLVNFICSLIKKDAKIRFRLSLLYISVR